ncbi:MAG: energy transducer TonB [Crocinitomicaceae bacterium]
MEEKKSKEANLESSKLTFFSIGLLMVSATILMAFTYEVGTADDRVAENNITDLLGAEIPEDFIQPEEEPEIEPEQAPPPPEIDEIEVKEDDEIIDDIDLGLDVVIDELPPDTGPVVIEEEPIADFAEVEPTFPGGEGAMMTWIQENIEYPQLAVEMGEQGIVYVQFVVNKDGSIEQVKIMRGVSDALDSEAKRVVRRMPRWTPGEQAGKKVRVRYTLPIHFRLG